MRGIIAIIVAMAGLSSGPAFAWETLDDQGGQVCGFGQTFDGPGHSTVVVSQRHDEIFPITLLFSNDNWSITPGDELADRITLESDSGYLTNLRPVAVEHGFKVLILSPNLRKLFGDSGPRYIVVRKNKQMIDRLDFSGFQTAWIDFQACRDKWVQAAREAQRLESIARDLPRDPFAKDDK